MTIFEITIIVLLLANMIVVGIHSGNMYKELREIQYRQSGLNSKLQSILDVCNQQQNAWACDVTTVVERLNELTGAVDKMHKNLCVEIADKMVNKIYPVNEGESLDAPFVLDYKLKKDIENKLNGFAAAVLDAECCPQEILDLWAERICKSAHKFIKQFKIDWDKLSKEQQDEFLKRLIMPNYDSPFQPPFNPTCETTNKGN